MQSLCSDTGTAEGCNHTLKKAAILSLMSTQMLLPIWMQATRQRPIASLQQPRERGDVTVCTVPDHHACLQQERSNNITHNLSKLKPGDGPVSHAETRHTHGMFECRLERSL